MTSRVFLSYSRDDADVTDLLARTLGQQGFSVFLDRTSMHAGQFTAQLESEIAKCDAFVVVLSPSAIRSHYVNLEVHAAHRHRRPLVPVLVEDTDLGPLQFLLGNLQHVDLTRRTTAQLDSVVDGVYRAIIEDRHRGAHPPGHALVVAGTVIAVIGVTVCLAGMGYFFVLFGQAWNAPPGTGPPENIPVAFGIFFVGFVLGAIGEGLRRSGRRRGTV